MTLQRSVSDGIWRVALLLHRFTLLFQKLLPKGSLQIRIWLYLILRALLLFMAVIRVLLLNPEAGLQQTQIVRPIFPYILPSNYTNNLLCVYLSVYVLKGCVMHMTVVVLELWRLDLKKASCNKNCIELYIQGAVLMSTVHVSNKFFWSKDHTINWASDMFLCNEHNLFNNQWNFNQV